jgi:hypothetical protein
VCILQLTLQPLLCLLPQLPQVSLHKQRVQLGDGPRGVCAGQQGAVIQQIPIIAVGLHTPATLLVGAKQSCFDAVRTAGQHKEPPLQRLLPPRGVTPAQADLLVKLLAKKQEANARHHCE